LYSFGQVAIKLRSGRDQAAMAVESLIESSTSPDRRLAGRWPDQLWLADLSPFRRITQQRV
jgi:hypothetical protein